jgi:hypothetical protein
MLKIAAPEEPTGAGILFVNWSENQGDCEHTGGPA